MGGKGKLARFAENETFENVFQPTIAELEQGYSLKGQWRENYFQNNGAISLELGCGKGEYSLGLSQLHSEQNFIGVDIKGARLWRGAKTAIENCWDNVAFVRTHIGNLPKVFGKEEVVALWLPCPDPQMKRARKRLTGAFFLNLYQQFLVDKGLVHLKTDSNFMYLYTKAIIAYNQLPLLVDYPNIYAEKNISEELHIKTFYEQQFLDRGIVSKYLCFQLPHKLIQEPEVDIPRDNYRSMGR